MPHITIDHADDPIFEDDRISALFDALQRAYEVDSTIVPENVKLRSHRASHHRVAGGPLPFLHIEISLMEGPTDAAKSTLADALFEAACTTFQDVRHVTLEVRDMSPSTYRKRSSDWSSHS